MKNNGIKVAVGLSGGVDSSVAAALLLEQGYDVIGITMEIYDDAVEMKEGDKHACFGPGEKEDVERASSICERLGIPFHTIDLKMEYRKYVINYFRDEYLKGRTPNPCVMCNNKLKFGFLLEKTKDAGVDFAFFGTGHYAKIRKSGERYLLQKAADHSKDQTYFLYTLKPAQLSRILFPLGSFTKPKVREIARSLGLETAESPESQDFIAGNDYSILFNEKEISSGNIVDEAGNILGMHRGIIHYTIGQRKGLGIASDRPLYVSKIDAENNRIVVGNQENLFSIGLVTKTMNLLIVEELDKAYRVKAKIRLKHRGVDASILPLSKNTAKIMFDEPQLSVTPGQSVVLYIDDTVFGGGIIERSL